MGLKDVRIRIAISISVFFAILGCQCLYQDALFNYSLEFEPRIQEGQSQQRIDAWAYYTSHALNWIDLGPWIMWLLIGQRQRAVYYVMAFNCERIFTNGLKAIYSQPRPYWVSPDVVAWECENENFGNPSGHSIASMGKAFIIFLDYAVSVKKGQ